MSRSMASMLAISLIAVTTSEPAFARRANSPQDLEKARDFDLARHVAARAMPRGDRERAFSDTPAPRFTESPLGPRWSYQIVDNGPHLEFSALGAGGRDAPRLLHVGVDWQF